MAIIKKFRIKSFKETSNILELKNVSVSYGDRQVLNNLSLSINKGEIMGLLGPNGVGKSTIFHLITGLIKPNYGKILINKDDATNKPIYERNTKYGIGYVPQYGGYFSNLTLFENLLSIAEIQIKDKRKRLEKINQLISQFELESVTTIKAKYLSGGQKKKLVIAMALVNNPKLLLLDECFAALDVMTIKMLQEIIVNLQKENQITICICDHQARDLLSCVDTAMIISNCKIIAEDSPSNLVKNIEAKDAYFGNDFKFN